MASESPFPLGRFGADFPKPKGQIRVFQAKIRELGISGSWKYAKAWGRERAREQAKSGEPVSQYFCMSEMPSTRKGMGLAEPGQGSRAHPQPNQEIKM